MFGWGGRSEPELSINDSRDEYDAKPLPGYSHRVHVLYVLFVHRLGLGNCRRVKLGGGLLLLSPMVSVSVRVVRRIARPYRKQRAKVST
jgi:hypothetical protein